MKGPMIIFLVAVFLLLIVAYLAQDTEPQERVGSKAYHMLLLGLMRLDIAFAHGMRYVQISLAQIFKGYHVGSMDETILRKEQHMQDYRRMNAGGLEYKQRQRYNRKILE